MTVVGDFNNYGTIEFSGDRQVGGDDAVVGLVVSGGTLTNEPGGTITVGYTNSAAANPTLDAVFNNQGALTLLDWAPI